MKIGFCGVGKLGLPIALSLARRHDVLGYDVFPQAKEILRTKVYPHRELYAQDYLNSTALRIADTVDEVVAHGDIIIVIVQTPHRPAFEGVSRLPADRADFDYSFLRAAVSNVADAALAQKKKVVVNVMSTVLPGTVEREIRPLLNEYTALCYNPAFPAMGTAIPDYENPEFVLLGVDDEDAADAVRELYASFTKAPVAAMSIASAEATKVFYNSFISAKIALANAWMEVCHRIPGADVDDVSNALAMANKRVVSPLYMRGGMGDSGGCFVEGELIHTENGVLPIEDIQQGDRVLGSDGMYHEVLETYRRPYKGKVVTLKGRGLTRFTVTPEHPVHASTDLRTKYENGRRDQTHGPQLSAVCEIAASDLSEDHYIAFPSPRDSSVREVWTPEREKFGPKPNPVFVDNEAYVKLSGYYMAEGSIWFDKKKNYIPVRVSFSFNTATDGDYIAELCDILKVVVPGSKIRVAKVNDRGSCTDVTVNSALLAKALDHDFGHGYEDKFVPGWILNNDKYSAMCLRGLFRGDGSSHDAGLSFSTISTHLAHGVSLMLRRHGIPSTLQYNPKRVGADGVTHRAAYDLGVNNAAYLEKLAEIVGMPIRHKMQDKQYPNVIFEREGVWYHKINSIETSQYEGTVYNLNVADVHNYVSVGGLVSNCHPRDNIALSWLSRKFEMKYDLFGDLMRIRESQTDWLAELVIGHSVRKSLPLVILGKAYKAGTNLTVGSCSTLLQAIIVEKGHTVDMYDPYVDMPRAFANPSVFVIATNHEDFYDDRMYIPKGSVVIDPWGRMRDMDGVEVVRVGRT